MFVDVIFRYGSSMSVISDSMLYMMVVCEKFSVLVSV